jgi:hypothetical protein
MHTFDAIAFILILIASIPLGTVVIVVFVWLMLCGMK